jgi:hypothetical protein
MSDSTDSRAKLTAGQFVMEARTHASEQAEHGGHRWHLILQIVLVVIAGALVGAGYEFHVNELFFVAGGTVIVMLASYVHARLFSGYYAIYCREWERAEGLRVQLVALTDKRKIRESIGRLLASGNALMVTIKNAHALLPIKEAEVAQVWMDNAASEIGKLLDSSYVARFHSPTPGIGQLGLMKTPENLLVVAVHFRLMRLNEFLAELAVAGNA